MHSAKFIEVIKTFSKEEFKKFGTMITSPYFNSEKVLITLHELFKKHYPEFNSKSLEKENVFTRLYPGKEYNDALMRNVFSDMLKLTEEYLLFESYKKEEIDSRVRLMKEFSERKLTKLYEKNLDKAESLLENVQAHDIEYYRNKLRIEQTKIYHAIIHKDIYINPKNTGQLVSDNITKLFLMEMLSTNLKLTNSEKKYDYKYIYNFEEEIDSFLNNNGSKYLEIPYIKYYYYSFKLLKTQEEKYYILLKEFADSGDNKLTRLELRDIFISLINYCYVHITNGEDNYIYELFSIVRSMTERNNFTTAAGNIPNVFFMNAVTTGLETGEIGWVEKFIADNGEKLKVDSKTDTLHFCNAHLSYFKKDYDRTIKELAAVNIDDMTYKHNTKSLYLKLYYDLNDTEVFLSHIDSYKHFIAKNKLVFDKIKDSILNYINYANRLFSIKNKIGKSDELDLPALKSEIVKCTPLINRPWLLRKIEEIE